MKFSFAPLFTKLTLATSIASALVGCDEPNYPTPTPATESSVGQARVLVVNAAPGSQGVTTLVDNTPFGAVAPYLGTAAATYTAIGAGQRLFLFNDPANIPATPSTAPVGTAPITSPRTLVSRTAYLGGTNYTTFITNLPTRAYVYPVTATSNQGGIQSLTLTDNLAAPTVANNAKIRFVNLSPSGTYGIFNTLTATSLFSAAPTRAFQAPSFGTGAATVNFASFTEVAAGTYNLDVRSNATSQIVGTQLVGTTFAAGKIYTLYVRGVANSTATPLGISVVTHN
ncbi:MAG TPA: hypothetical protein VF598_01610 [Hymenobacter sp.]|jgi:hypothetical protein